MRDLFKQYHVRRVGGSFLIVRNEAPNRNVSFEYILSTKRIAIVGPPHTDPYIPLVIEYVINHFPTLGIWLIE